MTTIIYVITFLLIALTISYALDYVFYKRITNFQDRAYDLCSMYNSILESLKSGCISITYEGIFYQATVENQDYRSFILQVELAICDVLDAYDKIGDFFLGQMDNDLAFKITHIHRIVVEIQNSINVVKWQNNF